ncbi:uncharacterized protein [Ptychodera flava]|uniref:uncharacterized protein n=1 Tax=Ptychodera flava TaxID=63121 RepID=UPI003969E51D
MSWSSNPTAENVSVLRGERISFPFDLPATTIHSTLEHLVIPYFGGTAGDRAAIIYGDKIVTFNELNARANALARSIRKRLIVKRWQTPACVGLHMGPSDSVIVAIFAILKLGLAYLPLDPMYPTKRLSRMIETARPVCVLTEEEHNDSMMKVMRDIPTVRAPQVFLINQLQSEDENKNLFSLYRLDERDKLMSNGESSTACILYTSGSTGLPKGVIISHRAILHRVSALWNSFYFTSKDVGCFKASLSFVDSITEIFGFLLRGNPIVVAPYCITSTPARFIELLDNHDVTWVMLVPSLLDEIVNSLSNQSDSKGSGKLESLKYWVMTGEVLPIQLAKRFFDQLPGRILCNLWGATELTGDVTHSEYTMDDIENCKHLGKIPIGTPIQNTNIYVLDENMQPVDISELGVAYVSGPNLSDGYLNGTTNDTNGKYGCYDRYGDRGKGRKEPKRFQYNPFDYHPQHAVLYNTGDYVRAMKNSSGTGDVHLVFEGRTDSQVKIRGFRIDLIEIEAGVYEVPGIMRAHVFCHIDEDESKLAVAYYIARDMSPGADPSTIRDHLATTLPSFSMPKGVIRVDSFPLLPNGKIDVDGLYEVYKDSQLTPEQLEEKREERRAKEEEEQRLREEELARRAEEERQREEEMIRKAEERRKQMEEMMKKAQEEEERRAAEREKRLEEMRRQMKEREEELERIRKEEEQKRLDEERALEEELDMEIREAFEMVEEEVHAEEDKMLNAETKEESEYENESEEDDEDTGEEEDEKEKKDLSDAEKVDGEASDAETEGDGAIEVEKVDHEVDVTKVEEHECGQEIEKKDNEDLVSDEDVVEPDHPTEEPSKAAVIKLTEDHAAEQAKLIRMDKQHQENGSSTDDGENSSQDEAVIEQIVEEIVKKTEMDEEMEQTKENGNEESKQITDLEDSKEKDDDQSPNQKQQRAPTPPNTPTDELNANGKSTSSSNSSSTSSSSSSSSSEDSDDEDDDDKGVAKDATPDVCKEIDGEENGENEVGSKITNDDTESGDVDEERKADVEHQTDLEKKEEAKVPKPPEKSPQEKLVLSVVRDILKLSDDVTLENNFFQLGGDSINAVQTVKKLKEGGLNMTMTYFFQAETLADLAKYETSGNVDHDDEFEVPGYEIVSLHESTVNELEIGCQLAVDSYVKSEPLTAAVDIPIEEKKSFLDTGMKMVAIDGKDYSFLLRQLGTRKIVGMMINMDFYERKVDDADNLEQINLPKMKAFANYSAYLEKTARDIVDVKEVKQWLIRLATVISEDTDISLKAPLQKLMEIGTLKVAKANNYKGVCGVYTHPLTTAVAKEVGMVAKMEFDHVKDYECEGEKCFTDVKPPDLSCFVLTKEV